jgi:hypothetical protein
MHTVPTRNRTLAAAVTALAMAVAACDSNPGAPENPALSQAEANALAEVVTADVSGLPDGAAYDGPTFLPFAPSPPDRGSAGCATRSPDPAANSDGDPVPDSVRVTYDGCVFSSPRFTIELSGTIDIVDLNPTVTDHAIKWVITDLTRTATHATLGTTTTVENGTRLVSATTSVLEHQLIGFTSEVTFPNGSTASHVKDWSTTFTADVAGSISPRQRLPSGTWEIDGTSSWTHGERSASLDVSTAVPLHHNAECTVRPAFDAGRFVIVASRGGRTSTVTIEYTACGQYTVTRS